MKVIVTDPVVCSTVLDIPRYGQWFSPLAILLSATIAGIIAGFSVKAQREIARKRATLDVILKSESDQYFERIYSVFASEKQRKSGLQTLLDPDTDGEKQAKWEVDNFLNHYELIAISIEQKILDENFYKTWMRSTYIRHYKESELYIEGTRRISKSPLAYIKFEQLAQKWEMEKLAEDKKKEANKSKSVFQQNDD
ncbi:hypothetical protein TDB9533_03006 [Thalassocella blandensis]|nr:hypothetical protein TDB9533_03006 [Thalassocella blandensis]